MEILTVIADDLTTAPKGPDTTQRLVRIGLPYLHYVRQGHSVEDTREIALWAGEHLAALMHPTTARGSTPTWTPASADRHRSAERILLASGPHCRGPVRRSPDGQARREMGTWDIGPFDNDTAADFGGDLDEAALEEPEALIRGGSQTRR
jgi:hypothetical protein